eukprot:TRINITY_DN4528_c0_g1_i6.p1 TRINITY_DN4528_c0_g1~~TRINITY_DN4528_c0_g1_i6.p1  ORF type:complete len:683 (-),score=49.96 TRINITY_DN4528_c0_g1_i6:53-2101(-)
MPIAPSSSFPERKRGSSKKKSIASSVRDLMMLREIYSTARQVYTQFRMSEQALDTRAGKFRMAAQAVRFAVRAGLQKKRRSLHLLRARAMMHIKKRIAECACVDSRPEQTSSATSILPMLEETANCANVPQCAAGNVTSGEQNLDTIIRDVFSCLRDDVDTTATVNVDRRVGFLVENISMSCESNTEVVQTILSDLQSDWEEIRAIQSQLNSESVNEVSARIIDFVKEFGLTVEVAKEEELEEELLPEDIPNITSARRFLHSRLPGFKLHRNRISFTSAGMGVHNASSREHSFEDNEQAYSWLVEDQGGREHNCEDDEQAYSLLVEDQGKQPNEDQGSMWAQPSRLLNRRLETRKNPKWKSMVLPELPLEQKTIQKRRAAGGLETLSSASPSPHHRSPSFAPASPASSKSSQCAESPRKSQSLKIHTKWLEDAESQSSRSSSKRSNRSGSPSHMTLQSGRALNLEVPEMASEPAPGLPFFHTISIERHVSRLVSSRTFKSQDLERGMVEEPTDTSPGLSLQDPFECGRTGARTEDTATCLALIDDSMERVRTGARHIVTSTRQAMLGDPVGCGRNEDIATRRVGVVTLDTLPSQVRPSRPPPSTPRGSVASISTPRGSLTSRPMSRGSAASTRISSPGEETWSPQPSPRGSGISQSPGCCLIRHLALPESPSRQPQSRSNGL